MVLICQFEGTCEPIKLFTATRDGFTCAFIHHDDADKMIAKHQSQIDRALASLFAADTLIVRFEELAESLTLTTEEGLDIVTNTVTRLLSDSVLATKDRLKSFLAAWASLEIFVNKFCSKQPAIPSQAQKEPVLVFRFNSAAKNLGVNDPDKKEAIFKQVKKSRDDLLHGKEVDDRLFPIEETQALVRAFLENIS